MKKRIMKFIFTKIKKSRFFYRKNVERTSKGSATSGWHSAIEMSGCVSGSGRIICNGISYDFNKGDIFIIGSNALHSIVSDSHLVLTVLLLTKVFLPMWILISKT